MTDETSVQTIFDIYRDWPFLGIIAALAVAIYLLFRSYQKQTTEYLESEKETRKEYLENTKELWDKHKSERDEMREELKSRDHRAETIMQKLITTLEQDRKQ